METTTNETALFIGKCKRCKAAVKLSVPFTREKAERKIGFDIVTFARRWYVLPSVGGFRLEGKQGIDTPCSCGNAKVFVRPIRGVLNPAVLCNARCTHATGADCECSCGGRNHASKA